MIIISIPRYRKVKDEKGEHTVFEIHVSKPGASIMVDRRYSDFSKLDKRLRKIIYTPNLPPKTLMNKGSKLLETRREGLERYLQDLIGTFEIYDMLSEFLEIRLPMTTPRRRTISADDLDGDDNAFPQISHQSLLHFTKDPVVHFYQRENDFIEDWNGIPDTVIKAVIAGIYENDVETFSPSTSKSTS